MPRIPYRRRPTVGTPINFRHPRTRGLVGAWDLLGNNGNVAYDSTKIYGNGSISNGALFQNLQHGNQLVVAEGSNQYIEVPHNNKYRLDDGAGTPRMHCTFSIKFLYNATPVAYGMGLISKQSAGSANWFDSYINGSNVWQMFISGSSAHNTVTLTPLTWYHAHVVVDDVTSNIYTYLNGQLVDTFFTDFNGLGGAGRPDTSTVIRFGGRVDASTRLTGKIAFARLWNRTLSTDEVRRDFQNPWEIYSIKTRSVSYAPPTSTPLSITVSESLSFGDSLGVQNTQQLIKSDALTLTDLLSLIAPRQNVQSDSYTLTDAAVLRLVGLLTQASTETLTYTDALKLLLGIQLSIASSTIAFSDTILLAITSFLNVELSDSILLTDKLRLQLIMSMVKSDSLSFTDAAVLLKNIQLSLSDTLVFTDTQHGMNAPTTLSITKSDALAFTDSITLNTTTYITTYLRAYLNDIIGYK